MVNMIKYIETLNYICYIYNGVKDEEPFTDDPIPRQPPVNKDEGFTVNPKRDLKNNHDKESSK
jgi:hypothetical protein